MRRVVLAIALCIIMGTAFCKSAEAGFISDKKAEIQKSKIEKSYKNEIKDLFDKQDIFAKKYDLKNIKSLYGQNFIDNDGYNKEVYFSLVKDTWDLYPDITYETKIKKITLNGEYAIVDTEESSVATSDDVENGIVGELHSQANCRYHLQRFSNKWEIIAEEVLDETSSLKYGEARFINMTLKAPGIVGAGQNYTATLNVELPKNNIAVASINQEKIINPPEKPEESYKRLSDNNTLARIFTANEDNVNEYIVAAVGLTGANADNNGKIHIFMNGLAFVMTRVNIVPKNNFARVGEPKDEH